jgi:biotin synthase
MQIRNDWTKEEIAEIYNVPLLELIYKASVIHHEYQQTAEVQVCTLLSIKTGGCPEDCAYCPQAARYHTGVDVQALMQALPGFAWEQHGVKCAIIVILTGYWKW